MRRLGEVDARSMHGPVDTPKRDEMRAQFRRLWLRMVAVVVVACVVIAASSKSSVVIVGTLVAGAAVIVGGAGALAAMRMGDDE